VLFLALAGCMNPGLRLPGAEPPPTITLHVVNLTTGSSTDLVNVGEVTGRKDDRFRVGLQAKDPVGDVQSLVMNAGYATTCTANGHDQTLAGSIPLQQDNLRPAQGQTTPVLENTLPPNVICPQGSMWTNTLISFWAEGLSSATGYFAAKFFISLTPDRKAVPTSS
jgi:hypothetical protein